MMKIIFASLLAISIIAGAQAQTNAPTTAEWQSIVSGTVLTVECANNKSKDYRDIHGPFEISIGVNNRTSASVNYSADVFFLVNGNDGVKAKDRQTLPILISAGSSTNLKFQASNHREGMKEKLITNWIGYIVRLCSNGQTLKTAASSQTLERLAKDPEQMQLLESGKTVPIK